MKITPAMPVAAAIEELGRRIRQRRVALNLTQIDLAEAAGVPLRTIERMEGGTSVGLDKFVQVMRSLKMTDSLDMLLPENEVRPLQQLGAKTIHRQRASSPRASHASKEHTSGWVWGDQK
jgi:transcriptional regulator with XRE-family HTH domain